MKNKKVKIKFHRPRLIRATIYFLISLGFLQASMLIEKSYKYLKQVVGFVGILFLILSFVAFGKLFTKEIRAELFRRISSALFNATKPFRIVINKIKEKLGLNRQMMNGDDDEKTIVIVKNERLRKKSAYKHHKYSDMRSNRERIRFLWTKYILDKKQKNQKFAISYTPSEIKDSLDIEDNGTQLFALYYPARYGGDDIKINNKDVEAQADFVGTGGKI